MTYSEAKQYIKDNNLTHVHQANINDLAVHTYADADGEPKLTTTTDGINLFLAKEI